MTTPDELDLKAGEEMAKEAQKRAAKTAVKKTAKKTAAKAAKKAVAKKAVAKAQAPKASPKKVAAKKPAAAPKVKAITATETIPQAAQIALEEGYGTWQELSRRAADAYLDAGHNAFTAALELGRRNAQLQADIARRGLEIARSFGQ